MLQHHQPRGPGATYEALSTLKWPRGMMLLAMKPKHEIWKPKKKNLHENQSNYAKS